MNNIYLAVTVKQDRNGILFEPGTQKEPNPGYYAYVVPCSEDANLVSVLGRIGGLLHANAYTTKKKAAEAVTLWNKTYKANGEYLFDTPAF